MKTFSLFRTLKRALVGKALDPEKEGFVGDGWLQRVFGLAEVVDDVFCSGEGMTRISIVHDS